MGHIPNSLRQKTPIIPVTLAYNNLILPDEW